MDLDQLQSVRDRERQTDRLQQLRDSFYEEAAEFVRELRAERETAAAAADDPFDAPRVSRLTDRIRTAEQTLEAIYEKRVGKVVKAATFAAADLPAEAEGMTSEEAALFETLVGEIEANRAEVLGRLDEDGGTDVVTDETGEAGSADDADAVTGGADVGAEGPGGAPSDGAETSSLGAADVMGEDPPAGREPPPTDDEPAGEVGDDAAEPPETAAVTEAPTPPAGRDGPDDPGPGNTDAASADATAQEAAGDDAPDGVPDDGSPTDAPDDGGCHAPASESGAEHEADVERELVRITDDVGPILGVDEREYDLSKDDVVTLPADNARPLVERGVAERLE